MQYVACHNLYGVVHCEVLRLSRLTRFISQGSVTLPTGNVDSSVAIMSKIYLAYLFIYFVRPPDLLVGKLKFYHFFFLSSFCRQLLSKLVELNSTKTGHILESDCDLKMHVQNLVYRIPSPTHWGPKTTFFDDFTI